jgi:integrase
VQKFGKITPELPIEREEYLEDGKLFLFSRQGIFQARVYKGDGTRKYIYRSLKTRNFEQARKLAIKFYYEMEFRKAEALPLQQVSFNNVIDEYVKLRQQQYDRSLIDKVNRSTLQQCSIHMLRQIKRVVKFWKEYCGKKAVDKIDNAVLQDYVQWRKDFYHRMPKEDVPKNARLNPADKTLEWEVTLAKTMLKFADERGYRGKIPLPTWRFVSGTRIVRPAFTGSEIALIYRGLQKWIRAVSVYEPERRWNREMLRDYVHILAKSGMRVGEANNLQVGDVVEFKDELGRKNYQFNVKGKTGSRVVIPRVSAVRYIEYVMTRNKFVRFYKGSVKIKRKTDNKAEWFFRMIDGNKIITLIDQFQAFLKEQGILKNRYGEAYTLYSLRHFYAVRMLSRDVPVFDIARNMGTSVQNIELYYGKSATAVTKATMLGG